MATRVRQVHVWFYAIEPVEAFENQLTFASGHYPREAVLDIIRARDPSEESYRIPDDLFGGETLCLLHEDGPTQLLGAYYRDNLSKLLTEYKGQVAEAVLREGEAPVNSAYLAFFPQDVVGLVRTSSASPSFAKIGRWLTYIGGYACGLMSLADADTLAQLREHALGIRRLAIRSRRSAIPMVGEHSPSIAKVLRRVADLNQESGEVGVELLAGDDRKERFSQLALQELTELVWAAPSLEQAKVKVAGRRQMINLKRPRVSSQSLVVLHDTKQVGPREAAEALFSAYQQEQASIRHAIAALRGPIDDSLHT